MKRLILMIAVACIVIMGCGQAKPTGTILDVRGTRSVHDWVAALQRHESEVAENAGLALGQHPSLAEVVPPLVELLVSDDDFVYHGAIHILTKLGSRGVPELLKHIKDTKPIVRESIILVLGRIGEGAKEAIPQLIESLRDEDAKVRIVAAYALGETGVEAVSPILEAVTSLDQKLLGSEGKSNQQSIKQMLKLREADQRFRFMAAQALSQIGPRVLPQLRTVLADEKNPCCLLGLTVCQLMGSQAADLLPELKKRLDSTDLEIQTRAVQAVGAIGPAAGECVGRLAAFIKNPDQSLRQAALAALANMGTEARSAVRDLVAVMNGKGDLERSLAVRAIGSLGPEGKEAVDALKKLLKDADYSLRTEAALALWNVSREVAAVLPVLQDAMRGQSSPLKLRVAHGLGQMGPDARPAIPTLQQALFDSDNSVRGEAALALWRLDPKSQGIVKGLCDGLRSDSASLRQRSATLLGHLGAAGKEAVPLLAALAYDPIRAVRAAANQAALQIETELAKTTPTDQGQDQE